MGVNNAKTEPRKHHYVPQFLLKNFYSRRNKDEFFIKIFDKRIEKGWESNIKNSMCENDFHRFKLLYEGREFFVNYENHFYSIEDSASCSIKELIKEKNLTKINDQDKANIAAFITFQFLRTSQYRATISRFDEEIYNLIKQFPNSGDDDVVKMGRDEVKIGTLKKNEDQLKEYILSTLRDPKMLKEIASHLMVKKWVLHETNIENPFYISDNPVVMHNHKDFGHYGNIGFAVPGIEIYFPISSTLTLGMICPLLYKECAENIGKVKNLKQSLSSLKVLGRNPNFKLIEDQLLLLNNSEKSTSDYLNAFDTGLPISCKKENVLFFNSRQVMSAERFIACNIDNFELVKKMIKNDEKFKGGSVKYAMKF
ncbi:MAG: hypothetical protein ACJAS6_000546 [Rickettsiales bacterium]|jgi:hypothetical protein